MVKTIKNMKWRKSIRLKNYNYKTDGYYFVTICTHYRKPYLKNNKIRKIVVAELARLEGRFYKVKVDYFSVVAHHLHVILILRNSINSLSQIIQAFKSITTLKAKQALPLQIKERLWQPNYFEHVIRSEKALEKIREYIKNNPLKEKLEFDKIYGKTNADKIGNYKK